MNKISLLQRISNRIVVSRLKNPFSINLSSRYLTSSSFLKNKQTDNNNSNNAESPTTKDLYEPPSPANKFTSLLNSRSVIIGSSVIVALGISRVMYDLTYSFLSLVRNNINSNYYYKHLNTTSNF